MSTRRFEYLLSVGSNVEPARWVERGLSLLHARFEVLAISSWFDVEAVGAPSQPRFVNLGLRLKTDLALRGLREACRRIEEACERRRGADRLAPRTLDLDAVFAAPGVPGTGALPHADLLAHAYVLCPCAEAWPDAVHPRAGATLAALAAERFPGWADAHRGVARRED